MEFGNKRQMFEEETFITWNDFFLESSLIGIICQENKDCIVKQMCSNKKINKKFNKKLPSDHSFNSGFLSFSEDV